MTRWTQAAVLARMRQEIEASAPDPGDRLPTERALAAAIGCSRQTLRAALARLEAEGEIWRRHGQGTFRGRAPLGHPVRETVRLQAATPEQLMQARLLIEPAIAAEAARRASRSDAQYLLRLVEDGRVATSRGGAEEADARFHRGVAEVAANPILIGLLDHLADARRRAAWQREWDRTYRRIGVGEFVGLHSDQHQSVVTGIAEGNADVAEQAMRAHLLTIATAMRRGSDPADPGL
ncbi:FadR/GntR family transcriptional regulator [Pseudooceanicola sp.]|uniref:FadR/GntR family transcriptional regulator n=1 Tax=Pseudooceanicola sp. TaxID=1914328 RepID=UPI0035C6A230